MHFYGVVFGGYDDGGALGVEWVGLGVDAEAIDEQTWKRL